MDVNVKSGNKKMIASGLFISDSEENEISLKIGKDVLNVTIVFKNDEKEKKSRIKWKTKDKQRGLIMDFINFNDRIGKIIDEPLNIANLKEDSGEKKQLYIKVQIKSISNKTKEFSYTFYIEDKNE